MFIMTSVLSSCEKYEEKLSRKAVVRKAVVELINGSKHRWQSVIYRKGIYYCFGYKGSVVLTFMHFL